MTSLADISAVAQPRAGTRDHRVTAVLVAHDGGRWLPRALAALTDSRRRPEVVVGVDTGSTDDSAELLESSDAVDEVVVAQRGTTFGAAVAAGLAAAGESVIDLRDSRSSSSETVDWVWLLHDDCAVRPDTLEQLLAQADRMPSAAVVGPKVRSWRRPDVLLECGIAVSTTGRPETGIGHGEVDQGQRDGSVDVMAVSSAGMLVRRDLWDRLGGFAALFPGEGADTDFCWRARRAGERVVVAPRALIDHRRAAGAGLRAPAQLRGTPRYQHRRTAVTTALIHAPLWRLPFTALRAALGGVLRCVLALLSLAPRRAWDDLSGTIVALFSWRSVAAGRRAVGSVSTVRSRELRHLRPTWGQRAAGWQETFLRPHAPRSASAVRTGHALRTTLLLVGGLALVCLLATWGLWFGDGRLLGGALQPAPDTGLDLLARFLSPWHEVGLGSPVAAAPYTVLVAAVTPVFLGSATAALQILLLLAPALAGLALFLSLRGVLRTPARVVAAVAYAFLPATVIAVDTGRLGMAVAAILLPFATRLLLRISGFTTPLPVGRTRTVAAAAFVVAALGAFSPALGVTSVILAAAAALVGRHGSGLARVIVVALAAAALLWPWSPSVLATPGMLLLDLGAHPARLAADAAPAWQIALLNPGGPVAGPAWIAAALAVAALLALIPAATRRAVVSAWVVILAGLVLALVQSLAQVDAPWSEQPVAAWPGAGTLVMGLGACTAVAVALGALRSGALPARIGVVVAMVAPVMVGGWWVFTGDSLIRRSEPTIISPFVAVASLGPDAPRSLELHQRPDGSVTYQLLSGSGPRLGDAETAPDAAGLVDFGSAVSRATAGSPQAVAELAAASVRFLTVDVTIDRPLARQLDAVPGIRRVSTLAGQGLWEVATPLPRTRAITAEGPVGIPTDVTGASPVARGPVPGSANSLTLAEAPDPVWRATLAGAELERIDGSWQAFTIPADVTGDVAVSVDPTSRLLSLIVPAVAALLLVVAAMRPTGPARKENR